MMNKKTLPAIFLLGILCSTAAAQDLVINEVMPSNNLTILDEDGDSPDWIELYNRGTEPIQLSGMIVADSGTLDNPWAFPDMQLPAGEHLLLFASDKDRRELPLHWQTIIDWGDDWSYLAPNAAMPSDWNSLEFDDSEWSTGPSGFGYGDNDDNTVTGNTPSVFLRKTFTVEEPSEVEKILFHIDYDDAFVAYINGVEIARENISSDGSPAYDQYADDYDHEAQLYQGGKPSVFAIPDTEELLLAGTNVIAVQVHNANATSSDLTAIPFLTLGSTSQVPGSLSEHLSTGTNHLHTNFKLSADGEYLMLLNAAGQLIDSLFTQALPTDVSYGRSPDGSEDWYFFDSPSPDSENSDGYLRFSSPVEFSLEGGLYEEPISVTLTSKSEGEIYYTTDGALPEISGSLYTSPIPISETTVLRAQMRGSESLPSEVSTSTYLIDVDHQIAIVSLTTHPDNLWDYNEGIYVLGPNAESEVPHFGANFWQDWEKPIHVEMYDADGDLAFAQAAGVKIFGAWSRAHDQKSLAIHARKSYGKDQIDDKIFDNLELDEFKHFVLRNSGNDWNNTMFRDALLTSLFHESVDKQAYRPAVVYLNGEYWGIQNLREKVNEDFLASHHDLDPDSLTILETNATPVEGDEQEYLELISYVSANNLSEQSHYEYVSEKIDIANFIYYQIGNIFIDNRDWPGNNIKYWKSNRSDGKWRWITYDTDFGFDIWNEGKVNWNTVEFALDPYGPDWPNPPWSTLLLRRLMENEDFKNRFINTFADELNTSLLPSVVIEKIDEMEAAISHDIKAHLSLWNGGSFSTWQYDVSRMRGFAEDRPEVVRGDIRSVFSLSAAYEITLEVNDNAFGDIRINTLNLTSYPWSGEYFAGVPVSIEALPKPGYKFLRWEGDVTSTSVTMEVDLTNNMTIRAVFEEGDSELNSIVINEINYNSDKDSETEDWVELTNKGEETIDLSGWVLKDDDDDHAFVFENGTSLGSGQFIVICRDMDAFKTVHSATNIVGNMDFGLSSDGDCVRLYNDEGILTDEVCFLPEAPWPTVADGKGGTMALKNPSLDNSDPESWYGLGGNGNPGEGNEVDLNSLSAKSDQGIFAIYPNPVIGHTVRVSTSLQTSQKITIELHDLTGKKIATLFRGAVSGEGHTEELNLPKSLEAGIYLITLHGQSLKASQRIIIQ